MTRQNKIELVKESMKEDDKNQGRVILIVSLCDRHQWIKEIREKIEKLN